MKNFLSQDRKAECQSELKYNCASLGWRIEDTNPFSARKSYPERTEGKGGRRSEIHRVPWNIDFIMCKLSGYIAKYFECFVVTSLGTGQVLDGQVFNLSMKTICMNGGRKHTNLGATEFILSHMF